MGTLYFIIKNTIVTIIIICFLQFQIGGKTLEERLMGFVHNSLAPKFLGVEKTVYKKEKKYLKMTSKDLTALKDKIYKNKMFDGVKKSAKDLFFKEMTDVIKDSQEKKLNELKKIEAFDQKSQ